MGNFVEIVYRFCASRGYTPVLNRLTSVAAAILGVNGGKYDLCASMTVETEERAESVLFSTPVASTGIRMVVRRSDVAPDVLAQIDAANAPESEGFRTASDLNIKGVRLGCVAGSVGEYLAAKFFPNAEIVYVNNAIDRPMMLASGHIDGYTHKLTDLRAVMEQYPSLVVIPGVIQESDCSFFADKTERGKALVAEFDHFLGDLKASGEWKQMMDKWEGLDDDAK